MGVKYSFTKKPDGLYINVVRDDSLLFPSSLDLLKTDLTKRRIPFDVALLDKAFEEARGDYVKIAPASDVYSTKPILRIRISPDKLKAYLIVVPFLEGTPLNSADIEEICREQKIINGLKNESFAKIVEKQTSYGEHLIAEGTKPQDGQNASLVFNFNPKGIELKPHEMDDGSVDFYNLNLIQGVKTGEVLVEKIPFTTGTNGKNVLGEDGMAKPGKDIRLPQGSNTQAIDNYSKLIATKDGHVVYVNGKVNVLATFEVRGDVDFSTGNIKFNGNVVVHGNVKNNFEVEATGDVEIDGNLEGVVHSDSNIQVKKGIVRGKAFARSNIYARYIENGQANCGENIVVTEAIMHSTSKAGRKVSVGGKKGLLVGGSCSAGEEIYAKNIGSNMGTSTTLEVGIRPELREEYKDICRRLIQDQENHDKNQKLLKTLQEIKQAGGSLPEAKNELYMKAARLQYQLRQEIEEFTVRKAELEQVFEDMQNARIVAESVICNGVTIYMGKSTFNVTEEMQQVVFTLDGLDIKYGTYVWSKRG